MSDSPRDPSPARWTTLTMEVHQLEQALSTSTLAGVLDTNTNHIASMEEEIDRKTREALVAYWLSSSDGDLPAP